MSAIHTRVSYIHHVLLLPTDFWSDNSSVSQATISERRKKKRTASWSKHAAVTLTSEKGKIKAGMTI